MKPSPVLCTVFALLCWSANASAAPPSEEIARLELAASRGERSASDDFNRGVAYLSRATSTASMPRDLGQAAAAFASARMHTHDAELAVAAESALAQTREALRAGTGAAIAPEFEPSEGPLWDALRRVGMERASWIVLALSAALAFALALAKPWRTSLGLGVIWLLSSAAAIALKLETSDQLPVVVVGDHVRAVDERHAPLPDGALSTGSLIWVRRAQPGWLQLRLHGQQVWLSEDQVREL